MKQNLIDSFLDYSRAANLRSTVDVKDGLKPVHRRILYKMGQYKTGLVGSSKLVGDVLSELHPHGDASVYDAAVRLSQPFKTRYPLISFEGNNGSVSDPTAWAHMRYTKMQLSPIGRAAVADIKKNSVDMVENFNGELLEPEYLPGRVPITLMNGTLGIGVGMSSSIPPHNLRELSKAIIYRVDNPLSTTKDLMRFIKGPDFPTGGTIANPESLLDIYETGSGSIRVKADYEIVTVKGKTQIVIKEVPFLVDPTTRIIAPLRELAEQGYEYIEDYEVRTGKGKPFEVAIILKKDAPVFQVVEKLVKETAIETNVLINLTTHVGDGKFQRMGLVPLIDNYISHNVITNNRIAKYEKDEAEYRKLIVEGLIKARAEIELVVDIIKNSDSTKEASLQLQKRLDLVEPQAKAVLAMRLSQLTKLDVNKFEMEIKELTKTINDLNEFLGSKELQLQKVKDVIAKIALDFGDSRRTRISSQIEVGEEEDVTVFLNSNGEIFAAPTDSLPVNKRNTKGKVFDDIISFVETKNTSTVWVSDSDGVIYPIEVAAIGISPDLIKNTAENLGIKGIPTYVSRYEKGDYIISVTKEGTIKKSFMSDYNLSKNFKVAKIRDGESLDKFFVINKNEKIIMILSNGKYVMFNENELNEAGINTIGVKLSNYEVLSVDVARDNILFVGEEGNAKRVPVKDLKESGRKGAGLSCDNSIFAASIDSSILVWGEGQKMIRLGEKSVSKVVSPTSKGVILYNGKITKVLT